MEVTWNNQSKLFSIKPPDAVNRLPHDIIVVMDVSASMNGTVNIKDELNETVETEYTLLDIVKFSTKLVTRALGKKDNFGLVTFSDDSVVDIPLQNGGQTWDDQIDSIMTRGMTDICDGIETAFKMVRSERTSILVFTDGVPNLHPSLGYKHFMDSHAAKYPNVNVHTFGYGNTLDIEVLTSISKYASGYFNYISDAGMVGTVFTYAMSNILSEFARKVPMVGTLRYGHDVNIVCEERPSGLLVNGQVFYTNDNVNVNESDTLYHTQRHGVGKLLENINMSNREQTLNELRRIGTHPDLKVDIDGEIAMAVANYGTWGKCYIPSLWSCYANEYNGNFRDKGTKRFERGTIFLSELQRLSETFAKMKPQKASRTIRIPYATPITSMSDKFMNLSMGCFTGESIVEVMGGTMVMAKDLVRGQKLSNDNVVENIVIGPMATCYRVVCEGLALTDWHPFNDGLGWKFPSEQSSLTMINDNGPTYNLVTKNGIITMGASKVQVITLGHGMTSPEILNHPYLGSQQVKKDVERHFDTTTGVCNIKGFTRDSSPPFLLNGVA